MYDTLKKAITRCGFTQETLSDRIIMTRASLNAKLNGKSQFTLSEAKSILVVLNEEGNYQFNELFLRVCPQMRTKARGSK